MNNEVKKINGYSIKDEIARNGLDYINRKLEEVDYIFPNNFDDVLSGDISIIKAYGKNIVIDTHRVGAKEQVYQMLDDNNVEHIDYLIISHYHDDHTGNVVNLINDGYVDSDTIVYLPAYCNLIENRPTILSIYNEIIHALNDSNISYTVPNENDYFTIGDSFKVTFYNCDENVFNESGWDDYNNMSMVCLVEHKSVKSLYSGDCGASSLIRMVENKFVDNKVNLYKIEHHGINTYNSTRELLEVILPDYAVQISTVKDSKRNNYTLSSTIQALKNYNTKVFSSHKNFDNYIVFKSYNNVMVNTSGIQNEAISNPLTTYQIYVDSSTTNDIQDGSQTNPYIDLPLAVAEAKNKNFGDIEIYLADGEYCNKHETARKNRTTLANCVIKIIGNSEHPENIILNEGFMIYNSSLSIDGCTIYCDNMHGISSNNSIVNINNCVITTYDTSHITNNAIYANNNSFINVSNCTLSNCVNGISAHKDFINSKNNTFINLEKAYRLEEMCILRNMGDSLTNVTEYISNTGTATLLQSPKYKILTSSQDVSSGSLQLNDSVAKFNRMVVITGYKSSNNLFSDEIFSYTNERFRKGSNYYCRSKSGTVTVGVDSSDDTLLNITCSQSGEKVRAIYGILDQYE